MDRMQKDLLQKVANTSRGLSIDMIEKANSGHPGLPLGCAEIGAILWGEFMRYNPKNPDWFNRDHFVLSAGHGSAFLYAFLHLSGYDLSMEDIKNFRQLNSKTPGHPERLDTEGVEVTTGPLGQGVGNAVGMALAYKILQERFNRPDHTIVDNKIICLAGDGCLMEGVSNEACSLAGHLCLDNLILLYDMNEVTLDGFWKESCSDDQLMRYRSYGWDVLEIEDANNLTEIHEALDNTRNTQDKPLLIACRTIIGKGSPNKAGTHKVHGSPLGAEEIQNTKEALGIPLEPTFFVSPEVTAFFEKKQAQCAQEEKAWNETFTKWKEAHPDLAELYQKMQDHHIPQELKKALTDLEVDEKVAGRKVSQAVLQVLAKHCDYLIGGSADLSGSDATMLKDFGIIGPNDFAGRNIKYGIREFGMATMANGMSTTMLRPFVGTFLCFSDYMRNALRLAALSDHPALFVFTHDSIGLGEDGPTHQPVEHYAALRAMPNLYFFRPGDANEVKGAWWWAINHQTGPVAFAFTRQGLPTLKETKRDFDESVCKGAYILIDEEKSRPIDYTLIATGSELQLAVEVHNLAKEAGKNVRVVSMPCMKLFDDQDETYKKGVLGGDLGTRVSIEAGVSMGWYKYVGREGITIALNEFGRSAPIEDVMPYFGFTKEQIWERIQAHCATSA